MRRARAHTVLLIRRPAGRWLVVAAPGERIKGRKVFEHPDELRVELVRAAISVEGPQGSRVPVAGSPIGVVRQAAEAARRVDEWWSRRLA